MKLHIFFYLLLTLAICIKERKSICGFFSLFINIISNSEVIRIFKTIFENYGIFYLWTPLCFLGQIYLYKLMVLLSETFPQRTRDIYPGLPAFICFLLQPLISICVIAQFQRKMKKRKLVFIPGILVGTAKYMPAYLLSIIKQVFFFETGLMLSEYSSIYFIMEGGSTDSKDRESVFAKRMTRYEVDTILGTMSFSMFFFQLSVGPIIFWTWHMSDPLIVIIRYLFILILVLFNFLKVFLVIYKCYLYLWHRKWEETYKDILSAGKAAPNIETIEFPKI